MLNLRQIRNDYIQYTTFLFSLYRFFSHSLFKSPEPLNYLHSRGVPDDYIQYYKLGYDPGFSKIDKFLSINNISKELLFTTGVVSKYGERIYDITSDRVIFPLFDILGNIVGFSGRIWNNEQEKMYRDGKIPKYINTSSSCIFSKSLILYNLYNASSSIKKNHYCILVEGMMDVISMVINGILNVTAPCGTSLTKEHAYFLKYFTDNVVVLYDNDSAGKKASIRTMKILASCGISSYNVRLPAGDPDSFVKSNGKEALLTEISKVTTLETLSK